MAYRKGDQVEPGIWHLDGSKEYIVEVSYCDPDTFRRVRKRQSFNRLDSAVKWRDGMRDDEKRWKLLADRRGRSYTFADFVPEYFEHWSRDRKPSTVQSELYRMDSHLLPAFGKKPLRRLGRRDIEAYLTRRRDQGISPATANRELCRLKNVLKKAQEWGLISSNPAEGIKQTKEQIAEQDFLSEDETARLLESCDDKIRPIVTTAVFTGMRWGELRNLQWKDVHFGRKSIRVRDPKNGEDRHVPLHPEVESALSEHRNTQVALTGQIVRHVFTNPATGRPWKDIRGTFRQALRAAGIVRHFPFKNLRHTAASHLVMKGVDIRSVGKILGHKTLQVTLRYAHLSQDHLRNAVNRLRYAREEKGHEKKA